MKKGIKKTLLFLLIIISMPSYGGSQERNEYEEPVYVYEFPVISPEIYIKPGYGFIEHKDSPRAGEFYYLHSSFGGEIFLKAFPFPHRVHLEFETLNKKDYFGDIRYAYKDIALLRGLFRGLYHNLDNKILIDSGPSSQYTVERRDAGQGYGTSNNISSLFMRFKIPDYPLHFFADAQTVKREGSVQQRFLSYYFFPLSLNRISMKREIDWESKSINIGTNTHLGPVEIELTHAEKRLDVKGDRLLENSYGGNIYPHNLMPDLKGSTTTFKIHTSYTGQIVASATLSRSERENEISGAKADYLVGAGDFTYMPHPAFTVFLRYRHRQADLDNPDSIPVNYLGYSVYSSPIPVRPSIDSTTDTVTGTIRYRAIKGLTLYAEYSAERMERKNSDEWKLPSETIKNTYSLSANIRPVNNLDLKAKYIHQDIDSPAYNNQPDTSDEGRLQINWSPVRGINGFFIYSVAWQKRKELIYIDNITAVQEIKIKDRNVRKEKLFGSLTFILKDNLTITPNFSYIQNKINQTTIYDSLSSPPDYYVDPGVFYRDKAFTYGLNLNYIPEERLNLSLDITHTISKGTFSPGLISEVNSIKGLETEADIRETGLGARADYDLKKGWAIGMRYSFVDYNDRRDNTQDGKFHLIFASISKKW